MHLTVSTMDRAALHNSFALLLSSRLHIREGVKTEPIITQGNQAIWHAINGCLDWWVSYLDERPPRGMLALSHRCYRGEGDATVLIVKVTSWPQQWRDASDQPEGDHTARSEHRLKAMQNKKDKHPPSLLQMFRFRVYRIIPGYAAHTRWLWFIKRDPWEIGQMPSWFLEDPLESFRDRLLIAIPSSSSSKLSLILGRK